VQRLHPHPEAVLPPPPLALAPPPAIPAGRVAPHSISQRSREAGLRNVHVGHAQLAACVDAFSRWRAAVWTM